MVPVSKRAPSLALLVLVRCAACSTAYKQNAVDDLYRQQRSDSVVRSSGIGRVPVDVNEVSGWIDLVPARPETSWDSSTAIGWFSAFASFLSGVMFTALTLHLLGRGSPESR